MKIAIAFAAGCAAILTAAAAQATLLDFSYTSENATQTATWTQSSDPTPLTGYGPGLVGVDVTDGVSHTYGTPFPSLLDSPFSTVTFNDSDTSGGFTTGDLAVGVNGPVIFTGTESAPIFSTGTYTLSYGEGSLTVTDASGGVPEPAAWSLMLLGVAGVGGLTRARRDRLAAA
jgi:hypothetical protein